MTGAGMKAYGIGGGRNEGRRSNIESYTYVADDKSNRTRVKFYLEGKRGKVNVWAEVRDDDNCRKDDYRLQAITIPYDNSGRCRQFTLSRYLIFNRTVPPINLFMYCTVRTHRSTTYSMYMLIDLFINVHTLYLGIR